MAPKTYLTDDLTKQPAQPPDAHVNLSQMFSDAALYERVINACPESLKNRTFFNADDQTIPNCLGGFNDLIGRDLSHVERAVTDRLAKLSVHNWASPTEDLFGPDAPQEEEEHREASSSDEAEDEKRSRPRSEPSTAEEEPESPGEPKLTPEEVVDLLEQEFGALAPPGEEKLLLEADAAFFKDVVILGVVHLTTHRFTFHASLLSSEPGHSEKIVKSGSALIHRRGWRRKRRVWLQLDHDMISSFPSSRDEDRIKPLRSILLSSIKEIKPVDWKRPRRIGVVFESRHGITEVSVEFDTIEAARDWRNELRSVIFLYRRNRRAVLDPTEDVNAIRLNIPLSRVAGVSKSSCLSFAYMISLTIAADPLVPNEATSSISAESDTSSDVLSESDTEPYVVQLSIIRKHPLWDDLTPHIEKAKAAAAADTTEWPGARVYIDFDPRTDLARPESDSSELSNLQYSVSRALGLDPTKDFFMTSAHTHGRFTVNYGRFAVNAECIGFWSRSIAFGRDVCYRVPIARVKGVTGQSRCKFGRDHILAVQVQGRRDLHIHFLDPKKRDTAVEHAIRYIGLAQESRYDTTVSSPITLTPYTSRDDSSTSNGSPQRAEGLDDSAASAAAKPTSPLSRLPSLQSTSTSSGNSKSGRNASSILAPLSRVPSTVQKARNGQIMRALFPKPVNVPNEVLMTIPSKHFVCLTIGSRGDVQPYIALGKALQKEGHRVTIVTHEEYKNWVTGFGIEHRTAGGDPAALMKLSVENKMFSPQFFKESLSNFRSWLDDLLVDSWEQCKDADVLLESPSAMAGVHIAEALHIPYFRTFTMPWTKTREFPHAFLGPPVESPTFNAASYILFDNVLWAATSSQINRWRKHTLGISSTDMGHLAQSKIPFIYNFSQAVVPKPLDWGDATAISGYWFLDNPELNWTPPRDLLDFIAKARSDGKALVYIGFGSIIVPNPKLVTERLIRAVQKSDVRAIISKGWSARMSKSKGEDDVVFPKECFSVSLIGFFFLWRLFQTAYYLDHHLQLDRVPHDWLFPKIDAALHHGGAGTTGASLRAGIPTLIRPWFGDQFFWASRVQKLGAGLRVNSLHSTEVANALKRATTDRVMKEKAASVGERIRSEDGVRTAIGQIYTYLPRAGRDRKSIPKSG
ncbi:glycosyltransferase family 1 protein [Russula earlei]|uniref:Glycosyltransferase family 1 protein n=1 Tax=Russula earlei TaxID=71964 RepID=A0ACC0UD83_9AGAM|nr:glycosyltransferase family 1 protein [Russula earlei]